MDAVAIIRELQVRLDTLHRIEVEPDHAPTMLAFLAGKIEAYEACLSMVQLIDTAAAGPRTDG